MIMNPSSPTFITRAPITTCTITATTTASASSSSSSPSCFFIGSTSAWRRSYYSIPTTHLDKATAVVLRCNRTPPPPSHDYVNHHYYYYHGIGRRFLLVSTNIIIKCSSRAADDTPSSSASDTIRSSSSSSVSSTVVTSENTSDKLENIEEEIEKVIYRCRFLAILGVFGSLVGSFLCFIKGCTYVVSSFMQYFVNRAKVIILLVEAIDALLAASNSIKDVYLLGTVMLVFGMGLYELFVSNLDTATLVSGEKPQHRSNLFGLFTLKERPRWLEVKTVNELKTKLGHVIVMLLLIGFFEKSKMAVIHSPTDLLCFSASVLLCSGCLYLLSKL